MLNEKRKQKLLELLREIGVQEEVDLNLVHRALVHPSYLFEDGSPGEHNQRLEFLGDAVVGLIIAQHLYKRYQNKSEGELTKMRAAIVCEASLAAAAMTLDLGSYLLMGRGELLMGGAKRPSNLADCFEAFIASLYMSLGLEKVAAVVLGILRDRISDTARGNYGDYKTRLQEHIQQSPENKLAYQIIGEEGPDHNKIFIAAVCLNEKEIAQGSGHTKKEAEQQAAKLALHKLGVIE
jgi:ribonuclease-3